MRKKSTNKTARIVIKNAKEPVFDEDWSDAARAADSAIVVRPLQPTSIKIEPELIAMLTEKGKKRGLPYQTMLKMIVREHIEEY